jgi:hypothetical protein
MDRWLAVTALAGFTLPLAGLLAAAFAVPDDAACLMAHSVGMVELADGSLVDAASSGGERADLLELRSQARIRIAQTFGAPRAQPQMVFFTRPDTFWPFKPNQFGSAPAIGNYACVLIGPKGRSVDVIAHELMHQELFARIGWQRSLTEVPIWFNEGIAMQLDYRPQYNLVENRAETPDTEGVRALQSVRQFNHGGALEVRQHYAFAKLEVKKWLAKSGRDGLYQRFERIRAGESFDAVIGR